MFYRELVLANETGYSNRDKQSINSSLFLVKNDPTKKITISGEKDASMSLIRSESRLIEKCKDNLLQPLSRSNNEAIQLSARNIIAAVKLNLGEEIVFHLNRVNNGIGPLSVWFRDQIQISTVAGAKYQTFPVNKIDLRRFSY